MTTIQVRTSELIGRALDWAIAQVEQVETSVSGGKLFKVHDRHGIKLIPSVRREYSPSTDWSRGGPLFDKYEMRLDDGIGGWLAFADGVCAWGETHLIAACRSIVAAKLGDVVNVPMEIME